MALQQYRAGVRKKRAVKPKASSLGSIFGELAKATTRASKVDGDQVVRLLDQHLPPEVRELLLSRSKDLVSGLDAIAEQREGDEEVHGDMTLAAALKAAPSIDDQLKSMQVSDRRALTNT